jgi:Glu-tRNA(Gln) amidotransferase subunit E-like FAD-binding protein
VELVPPSSLFRYGTKSCTESRSTAQVIRVVRGRSEGGYMDRAADREEEIAKRFHYRGAESG